ncbi:hypothetical protein DJ568_15695 [Mucilaginibacter hurinus]|uniref:Uncharacterized protein n=1 Tax=Mucilaginibacter hurinus TaxID=2201324 RepID=A0A367GKX9_9SPHI|nr:hypothetical protein [Mucilaginibacter hurinus]RCH53980.1 hypothetical protein DJ568_15695 [Mucilaginibacter hurinus]
MFCLVSPEAPQQTGGSQNLKVKIQNKKSLKNRGSPQKPASAGTGSTGNALAITLTGSGAAGSFLFGTFSLAEKEKVHPLAFGKHFTEPNEAPQDDRRIEIASCLAMTVVYDFYSKITLSRTNRSSP